MKITNYKSQITNKFQITMTKITKINKKRITTLIMGQEASWQKERNGETEKRRNEEEKKENGIDGKYLNEAWYDG